MSIEITNEPAPPPRSSGKVKAEVTVRLVDSKSGETVAVRHSEARENERRLRQERKY